MIQIQNHQKSAKNAKISDFLGKFTSKSGNTLKSVNFGPKNAKIPPNWKWPILEHQNYQIFTELPDLDLNIPKNCQFGVFYQFSVKKIWNIWGRCKNRTPNSRKAGYMCLKPDLKPEKRTRPIPSLGCIFFGILDYKKNLMKFSKVPFWSAYDTNLCISLFAASNMKMHSISMLLLNSFLFHYWIIGWNI